MGKKSRGKKTNSMLILSYVPGVYCDSGDRHKKGVIKGLLDSFKSPGVNAVMWVRRDNEQNTSPIFVVVGAKSYYDHILWWSHERPSEWFSVVAGETEDGYKIGLLPHINKSIERVRFDLLVETGVNTYGDRVEFITEPFWFYGTISDNWLRAKASFGEFTSVGFVDVVDVDLQRTEETDENKIMWLSNIKIARSEVSDVLVNNCGRFDINLFG